MSRARYRSYHLVTELTQEDLHPYLHPNTNHPTYRLHPKDVKKSRKPSDNSPSDLITNRLHALVPVML